MKIRRLGLAMACASATISMVAFTVPAALAGTNGQQVEVQSGLPWSYVRVCGTNNYNRSACSPVETGRIYYGAYADVRISGYWFKGWVTIYGYKSAHARSDESTVCYVPRSQSGSNWWQCAN
jgi:hypothetical protein